MEAGETYMGGKRRNLGKAKRKQLKGRGAVGKTPVLAIRDQSDKRVQSKVVDNVRGQTLRGFVLDRVQPGAKACTDDAPGYGSIVKFEIDDWFPRA